LTVTELFPPLSTSADLLTFSWMGVPRYMENYFMGSSTWQTQPYRISLPL